MRPQPHALSEHTVLTFVVNAKAADAFGRITPRHIDVGFACTKFPNLGGMGKQLHRVKLV